MMPTLRDFLSSLPLGVLSRQDIVCDATRLAADGDIAVHFVPFGYFPANARLALVA
jgi:hypothetical protein